MNTVDIHHLARTNRVNELRTAIRQGANLNEKDQFGSTALHSAIAYKNTDIISLLIENAEDVTAQDRDGSTALHYAIEHNLFHVAEILLKKNPRLVEIVDKYGNGPLWTAAFNANGDYGLVNLLLSYEADPKHCNRVGLSPIDIPKRKQDDVLLQILEK